MDLRPKLIVRKGATCRHESRGSPALRAVCTQRYLSSWPIGVVEHRTTRHQGRDVSAGTTAGAHRQYGIRASALRQTLVGMCTGFDRIEHAAPFLRARRMPWEEAPSVRHSIAALEWRRVVGAHLLVHGYVLPMRRAIAKRHGFSYGDETALCGKRRVCSPGLVCDSSSERMCASTARLVAAVQGLQGPGSRPVPLRAAHDPDRPTAVVRLTLRCETSLTWHCELRAAATTLLRRGRAFVCLECASRGWLGSIRRPEATCAADKGERTPMAVLVLRQALGAASCGGLVCVPWIIAIESTKTLVARLAYCGRFETNISRKTQHYSICRFGRFRQFKFETAAAFRGAARSQDTGPSGSASGLGLNSHPALLGRPHSTVRPSQDCVPSSKDAFANGGGRHFAAAAAAASP